MKAQSKVEVRMAPFAEMHRHRGTESLGISLSSRVSRCISGIAFMLFVASALFALCTPCSYAAGGDTTVVRKGDPGILPGGPVKYMVPNRMHGGLPDEPFQKYASNLPRANPRLAQRSSLPRGGSRSRVSADPTFWGGIVRSLAINSSGYIFAGTDGGVYISTDNGTSWTPDGLTYSDVYSLAINSSGYVFAGTYEGGVYLSTDNGASWTQVLTGSIIYSLAINSSGDVFAGTWGGGVCLSTDNGTSWTQVNSGLETNSYVTSLAINSSGYIFAGGNGVYLSTNNGKSWTQTGLTNGSVYSLAINSFGYIFAGTFDGGVYLSKDSGASWTQENNGLAGVSVKSLAINSSGYIFAGMGGSILGGTNIDYGAGAYLSTDNGTSWTQVLTPNTDVLSLAINSSGYIFAGTFDGGVYLSTNRGTSWTQGNGGLTNWTQENNGLTNSDVLSLAINSSGYIFAGTYGGGVYLSRDSGTSWTPVGLTNSYVQSLAINSSGYIFAGTEFGGVYFSANVGTSWTVVNNGLTNTDVQSLAINSSGSIFAGGLAVYLSTNNGTSWAHVNNGLTSSYGVVSLAISSSGYIYAGTDGGGVYLSTDNGTSWTQADSGLTNNYVWSLAIGSSGSIYAGTYVGVYISTNNGTSWTQTGLTGGTVYSLAVNSSGYVFGGTNGGSVFVSTNNGTSWTAVNNGLTNSDVLSLAIDSSGYIFAGTRGGGVFRSTKSTAIISSLLAPALASPANGATGVATTPTFTWNVSSGATAYELQVSTDSTFATTTYDSSGLTTTSKSIGGLSYQTKYYWRVNASNAAVTSGWSAVWDFTTANATFSAPTLASPSNGSAGVSTNPTLAWNASAGAASYRLQVSTDSTFATTIYDTSGLTATSQSISGLSYETKYYWRVNANGPAGANGWSATWNFTTANQLFWTQVNNGLTNIYVQPLAINSSGYIFAGTWKGGVYLSTNNGTSWTQVNNGLTNTYIYSLVISSPGYIFAGTWGGGVYLSTNNGTSWTQSGLTSRWVWSFAFTSSGYVFAGTDSGGVYLSTNRGTGWTKVNNGLMNSGTVYSLAIDSAGSIFAGTDGGVYVSTNNGTTWTLAGLMFTPVYSLAINSSGQVFAGTDGGGLYISTNSGATWAESRNGLPSRIVSALVINSFGQIIAGTDEGGVYLSGDNGASWTQNGLTGLFIWSLAINSSGQIFAGTNGGGVFRSTNSISGGTIPQPPTLASPANGATGVATNPTLEWNASTGAASYRLQVSTDSTFATTFYDTSGLTTTSKSISSLSSQTKYYWRVNATDSAGTSGWSTVWDFTMAARGIPQPPTLASPPNGSTGVATNPTLVWNTPSGATSYELQVSADSTFATKFSDASGLSDTSKSISGLSYQTKYYWRVNASDSAGTSGWSTVWNFTTANQLFWTQINNGLTNSDVWSLAINSTGYIFAGTAGHSPSGVYLSTNNGYSWTQVNNGLGGSNFYSLAINSFRYIFVGADIGVYLSTNNGTSWTKTGLADGYVYSFVINSSGYIFAGTYDGGVYLSTNNGAGWSHVMNGFMSLAVFSLAINSSGYIFAGTYNQVVGESTGGVYLSTDNGTSWTQVNNGLPLGTDVSSLAIDSSGYIFAGTDSEGVYLSTNNGYSWTHVNHGLPNGGVSTLAVNSPGQIFAGIYGEGVYFSTDNGTSWTQVDNGLTNLNVHSLAISSSGYIFAGTEGGGIYRASISSFLVTPPKPTLASPANGSTGVATNPTLAWNGSSGATSYELQVSTDSTFATKFSDASGLSGTSKSISGLSYQTKYYWRVNASGSSGTSGWSTVWGFTTFTYPSSILLALQYVPPSVIDSTTYEIIGLPGEIDIPMSSVISSKQGTEWNTYFDNGASQNYQVEYDGTSTFDFQPGRAFWILSKNPFSVSKNVSTVLLDTSDSYSIGIHKGWNLISNPFEKGVNWSYVQSLNGTAQPIWAFSSGSYSQPSTLDPYQGYYFYNDIGLSQLRIPYVYSPTVTSAAKPASVVDKNLTVALSDGNKNQSSITVGVKSAPGIDGANIFAPPGDFQRARICVVDSTVPAGWKELVKDYRDTIGTGQQFDFYVRNKTGESLKLSTNVGDGLSQYEVYLIDKDLLRSYNLKDSDQISIPSFNKLKNYGVLIGSKSFVDAKLAELLPKGFQLYQNYPNPFNPVTVIRFEVPTAERVSLIVYDVLGRHVETLMNANVTPGYYEIPFDGTVLASGVYFYRLSAGSLKQVKKMVLIK